MKTRYRFDPEEAARHLAAADRRLATVMERLGPFAMPVRPMPDPFDALARTIIFQQLHGKAAETIHSRVLALFGKKRLSPGDILGAPEAALRGAGVSQAKLRALQDLAAKTLDGTVPTTARLRRMGDEEIVERLTQVRGIGRWTVEMLLMFRLGRPDVLPVGDYGVRKGFSVAFELPAMPSPKELGQYGERWRPFRTVASWYMWRVLDAPAAT